MPSAIESDFSAKLEQLRAACTKAGARLVPAGINGLLDSCHVDLEESTFLSLLQHEKPSAVFFETHDYDPDRFIRGRLMALGWKEAWEEDRESIWPTRTEIKTELTEELAQLAQQVGLPRSLMATYAIEGLPRMCWVSAEWAEDLSEKIDAIVESREARAEEERNRAEVALQSLIVEVANDPEFKAIRGRPKRLLFLQKKYGERIPPHPRGQISRPAQNCDYVDENVAIVLLKANERAWASDNL